MTKSGPGSIFGMPKVVSFCRDYFWHDRSFGITGTTATAFSSAISNLQLLYTRELFLTVRSLLPWARASPSPNNLLEFYSE